MSTPQNTTTLPQVAPSPVQQPQATTISPAQSAPAPSSGSTPPVVVKSEPDAQTPVTAAAAAAAPAAVSTSPAQAPAPAAATSSQPTPSQPQPAAASTSTPAGPSNTASPQAPASSSVPAPTAASEPTAANANASASASAATSATANAANANNASSSQGPATATANANANATAADAEGASQPDMSNLFSERRQEERERSNRSLAEFLVMLDGYKPLIPEEVTEYYLQRAGFDCSDPRLKRLLSLSAQKFISDLSRDAFHFAKLRVSGTAAGRGRPSAGADRNKVVLTMDDLSLALGEHGVNVKKPDYYL